MKSEPTVVRNRPALTKHEIHALVMAGWARAIRNHGKGAFADKLEISSTGLDKQLTGSMPTFDVIDKALDAEETILDDYLHQKGKRLVDRDAACDSDDFKLLVARVNLKLEEYSQPDSPSGRGTSHCEYLDGETLMRELHHASARWLERCGEIRGTNVRSMGRAAA